MAENITERERDSAGSEALNPETEGARPSETVGARRAENAAFVQKCIADKKYPLAAAVVIIILIITIISLAVKKPPSCPPPVDAACPDGWIGYRRKCYYKSEDEKNWTISEVYCSLFGASLAVIDSIWDLDFLVNFTRPHHYWIGLSRKAGKPWRWPNGTEFKNQLPVRGEGLCAYINDIGLSSTRCSMEKNFLCGKKDACTRRK